MNLKGVITLNKQEQKAVNGGYYCPVPTTQADCKGIGGYWFPNGRCLHRGDYCL